MGGWMDKYYMISGLCMKEIHRIVLVLCFDVSLFHSKLFLMQKDVKYPSLILTEKKQNK